MSVERRIVRGNPWIMVRCECGKLIKKKEPTGGSQWMLSCAYCKRDVLLKRTGKTWWVMP